MRKYFRFLCPGCGMMHKIPVSGEAPLWSWNGNTEKPSFNPSILVQWSWFDQEKMADMEKICHFFIKNGSIIFCADCTHSRALDVCSLSKGEWIDE